MLVLEAISGLCRDPLALVEMFVNYDCDLQAIDLFKRIVTALAKVGYHTPAHHAGTAAAGWGGRLLLAHSLLLLVTLSRLQKHISTLNPCTFVFLLLT